MDGRTFWDRVHADERLEWLGSKEGETPADDVVIVRGRYTPEHRPDAKPIPLTFAVDVVGIQDTPWEEYLAIFLGRRQPTLMKHVARIVGYYSFMYSWNRSKLAENRDRHRGNYGVPEAA